jgi:hypothetical protein
VALEQRVIDLRLQLEERDQDLAAARAANRELMAQINTTNPNSVDVGLAPGTNGTSMRCSSRSVA